MTACPVCRAGFLEPMGLYMLRCDWCGNCYAPSDETGQVLALESTTRPSVESGGVLT